MTRESGEPRDTSHPTKNSDVADAKWLVIDSGDGALHVTPSNDIEPHFETIECHCHPERHPDTTEYFVIHNSFDRREYAEPDYRGFRV